MHQRHSGSWEPHQKHPSQWKYPQRPTTVQPSSERWGTHIYTNGINNRHYSVIACFLWVFLGWVGGGGGVYFLFGKFDFIEHMAWFSFVLPTCRMELKFKLSLPNVKVRSWVFLSFGEKRYITARKHLLIIKCIFYVFFMDSHSVIW